MQEEIIQKLGELLKAEDIQAIVPEVKSLEEKFYKAQEEKEKMGADSDESEENPTSKKSVDLGAASSNGKSSQETAEAQAELKVEETPAAEEPAEQKAEDIPSAEEPAEQKAEETPTAEEPTEQKAEDTPNTEEPAAEAEQDQPKTKEPDPFLVKFQGLMASFNERYSKLREEQKATEEVNFKAKQEVIDKLKKLIQEEENIGRAFHVMNELKDQWKEVGHVSAQKYKPLQNEYSKLLEEFYYTINIYKELKDHDLKKNFELKKELIKQISELKNEPSIKKVQTSIGAYLSSWDELGPTTPEAWDEIRDDYRKETQVVFQRIKEHYKKVKEDQKENLQAKQKLIDELRTVDVSGINNAKAWKKATDHVLRIQQDWRKVGFTNKKQHGQMWDDFRTACDSFFNTKKEFHAKIKGDHDSNAVRKNELIEKAIALQSSPDWKNTTNEYKNLQQQWKKIGPCSPRDEQKLWNKFHAACNAFFESRKTQSAQQEKSRIDALKKKKALLQEFEKLDAPKSADETKNLLESINKQWNEAGQVAFQDEKKLNGAFRKAVEGICNKAGITGEESEELMFMLRLERIGSSHDPESQFQREKQVIREKMSKLEASILQYENNLTFFTHAKGADELTKEVNEKVEKSREQVLELRKKLSMITKAMKDSKPEKVDASDSEQ